MSASVVEHFSSHSPPDLPSFRALCNALKALVIDESYDLWSSGGRKPLACVLDLCCGRGGDLLKWAQRGQKLYVGLDATPLCIAEAERRLGGLFARGTVGLGASFHVCDARRERFPCADASINIASVQFGIQYLFEAKETVAHALSEIRRCMTPGGVFACVYPDGERVRSALLRDGGRFGHFGLAGDAARFDAEPFGIPYVYSIAGSEPCEEYAVSRAALEDALASHGFTFGDGCVSTGAQGFFAERAASSAAARVLDGRSCSETDWLSLALFRVIIARLPPGAEPSQTGQASHSSQASHPGPPSQRPRPKRRSPRPGA